MGVERSLARLSSLPDDVAPDGSEIRLLAAAGSASMCHCTLGPGGASKAIAHRTVEELWYCLSGTGQVWRKGSGPPDVVDVGPGVSLAIPVRTPFQFRNTGPESLRFIIATIPPWPGPDEAVFEDGRWSEAPAT